jgi:hypothetical protein
MIVGTAAERPKVLAIRLANWQIVNAGQTPRHITVGVKLPILVSVRPKPVATVVVPFIRESDRNPVFTKSP